jgi:hypothetical protein
VFHHPLHSNILAVKSLIKKYLRAVKDEKESKLVFEELDLFLDDLTRQEWSQQEHLAITKRGDYLKIYQVQVDKSESKEDVLMLVWMFILITTVTHDIPRATPTTPKMKSDPKNASWLQHGLNVEQKQ